jgi:hypothetical protein
MSIQHRSRIKSVADYSANITSVGACCYARATQPTEEYYNTCVANGGHWTPIVNDVSEVACPSLGATGCCCSCSYVNDFTGATGFFQRYDPTYGNCTNSNVTGANYPCYQGGLQDNITFCECTDKGGVWAEGVPCSVYTEVTSGDPDEIKVGAHILCTKGGTLSEDVRWPGACCSGNTCDNVCSDKECLEAANSHGVYYDMKFFNLNYCDAPFNMPDDVIDCDSVGLVGDDRNFERDRRTGVLVYDGDFNQVLDRAYDSDVTSSGKSSCLYLSKKGSTKELICSDEFKIDCNNKKGMWSGFNKDNRANSCTDGASLDIQNFIENKKKLTRDTISAWKYGQRVLNLGRYVGEYWNKDDIHGMGVECFGTDSTGVSYQYYPQDTDNTENSNKTFAIIIADQDFNYKTINNNGWCYEMDNSVSNSTESSSWDPIYNTSRNKHLTLMRNIDRTYNNNMWGGWMIPTKSMLSFLYNQTRNLDFISNTTIEDDNPSTPYTYMTQSDSVFYWTSTFYTNIEYNGKTQLAYCQSWDDNSMVVLSPRNKYHKVRLIQAIEII